MRRLLATTAAVCLLLGGCGNETTPSAAVPELADRLEQVDTAVAADEPTRIRRAANLLIATAEDARESGQLDAGQVESIVAAAEGLLAELPEKVAPPEPTPTTPSPTPTTPPPSPTPRDEGGEDEEKDEKVEEKKPGKGKGRGNSDEDDDD